MVTKLLIVATSFFLTVFSATALTKHNVYVLGTIHGNMLERPQNSLRDFVTALFLYRPEVIFNEVRPEFPGPLDGSIDGSPEQALVYAYGTYVNAKIVPSDWSDDQNTIQDDNDHKQIDAKFKTQMAPIQERFKGMLKMTFEDSQKSTTQDIFRSKYEFMEGKNLVAFKNRNEKICSNLRNHLNNVYEKRVLVVFGIAHKYYLDNCYKVAGVQTLSIENWYSPTKSAAVKIPDSFKKAAIHNLEGARDLLRRRLKEGYYKLDLDNMKERSEEFDKWIEQTHAL